MNSAFDTDSDKVRAKSLFPVSHETEERLVRYVELLRLWQSKTNLVAPSTLDTIWTRHIADSLQLLALAPEARTWIDLGSGGGLPGIPIACALTGVPGASIHLVERNAKKAAFLREATRTTGIPVTVHLANIEDFVDSFTGPVDCVTARALAPLKVLLGLVEPLVRRGAKALLLKGQDIEAELTEAAKYWTIGYQLHPSRTSSNSWVIEIDRIGPASGNDHHEQPKKRAP